MLIPNIPPYNPLDKFGQVREYTDDRIRSFPYARENTVTTEGTRLKYFYNNYLPNKSTQIYSWNQPVLSNVGKVSCSRKHWEPLMVFKLMTDRFRDRHDAYSVSSCCLTHSKMCRMLAPKL